MSRLAQLRLLFSRQADSKRFLSSRCFFLSHSMSICLIVKPAAFCLFSCIQFQLLQTSCGVQGSAWGLQAPAESTDWWEPNLAWRAWTENSRRQNSKASAAAGHGAPAGTEHLNDVNIANSTAGSWRDHSLGFFSFSRFKMWGIWSFLLH